jgi:hypothetical protein
MNYQMTKAIAENDHKFRKSKGWGRLRWAILRWTVKKQLEDLDK